MVCQAEKKIEQAEKKLETVTTTLKAQMADYNRQRRAKMGEMLATLARTEARNCREVRAMRGPGHGVLARPRQLTRRVCGSGGVCVCSATHAGKNCWTAPQAMTPSSPPASTALLAIRSSTTQQLRRQ